MRMRALLLLLPLIAIAVIYGCTKERATEPEDGDGSSNGDRYTCLGCHAEEDSIKAHLEVEGVPRPGNRGDG